MKQNIRNIEFWKEFKNGDVIELDVNGKTNNDWIFAKPVYFDEIAYPSNGMDKYFGPQIKFQKNKEDLGDKSKGYGIDLMDIKRIKSINKEPVNYTAGKVRNYKLNVTKTGRVSRSNLNFEVKQMGNRWVCPCYNPENPDKYSYSLRSNAVKNHKTHLEQNH